jgi:hypothetical protein
LPATSCSNCWLRHYYVVTPSSSRLINFGENPKLSKIDQSGDAFGWNHHNSELRLFPVLYFTFLRTPENTLLGS